jgi:3-keto steroid reductase
MAIIEAPRLYAIVTGANSGVGLGISTRFLLQSTLALLDNPFHPPPDSLPQKEPFRISPLLAKSHGCPFFPCEGITLILACRSQARAMAARQTLLDSLRAELARKVLKRSDRDRLMDSVEIVWEGLDLSEMGNVHDFITRVQHKWVLSLASSQPLNLL